MPIASLIGPSFHFSQKLLGKTTEAERTFAEAIRLHDSSGAHINLGNILKERCDLDGALGHYLQALKREPLSHESMSNIGNVLKDLGRSVEAEDYYCRAISVSPRCVQWAFQRFSDPVPGTSSYLYKLVHTHPRVKILHAAMQMRTQTLEHFTRIRTEMTTRLLHMAVLLSCSRRTPLL